jgi:hypothetical protein
MRTVLVASSGFMTLAWYARLKNLTDRQWSASDAGKPHRTYGDQRLAAKNRAESDHALLKER